MKAVVYTAPLTLEFLEVADPQPAADEVLVRVAAVGICGSELEGFASQSPFRKPPLIMGHEFAGIRMSDGAAVVVNPLVFCGHCDSCRRGAVNVCRDRELLGIQRPGGFADYVAVPTANCHVLPADTPLTAAALVEPLANAVHALRLAQQATPYIERVGVIGAGMVGVAITVAAKAAGIDHVQVVDLSANRTAVARDAGADSVGERLDGEFDVVFDAVGTAGTREAAVNSIRPDGTVVFLGLHSSDAGFDGRDVIRNEKRVLGSFCYVEKDFADAVALVGRVHREWYEVRPLSEGVEAFTRLLETVPTTVKTVLVPGGAE